MRRARRLRLAFLAAGLAGLVGTGALLATRAGGASESDQGFLAGLVSRALSTPANQVHIGSVDGALSSDATINDIVISDRDGPWLKLDHARLVWRRLALLVRRLEVDRLEIGHLEIIRRPIPSDAPVAGADQPLLPDLPVKVQIKQFALADLDLGKPILGAAMRASATGDTELGSPSEGLVFNLDGRRLDSPGTFSAAMTYVPAGNALSLRVKLDEPAGGLVSTVGHLPGAPPVTFSLNGTGTLDAFQAGLDFRAGSAIDANGAVTLQRRAAGRDLGVKVGGHLGALLPALAASIFEGQTDLAGAVRIEDTGPVTLDTLTLTSHLASLDARGTLSADKIMDFTARVRAVPNEGDVSKAGNASIRKLVFDGAIQGPASAPRITATLTLADAHLPQGSLGRLDARFAATPSGAITDAATHVALDATLDASDIAPRDAALARAIGGSFALVLHGAVDATGATTVQRIEAKTPTLDIAYAGDLSRAHVHGRVTGAAPDLARFGDLAGLALAGHATLGIDLDGVPKRSTMTATVGAELHGVATGITALDRLSGREVSAKGVFTSGPGTTYGLRDLAIEGAHAGLHAEGTAGLKAADMRARITLPDLARADPRLTGGAVVDARLTGGLDRPDVALTAAIDAASAMGRPIPHLALTASVNDLRGTTATRVTLDGTVDRKRAAGLITLARRDGGWDLGQCDIAIGSVTLKGAGTIDRANLAQGALHLAAGTLDDLSALALTKLDGSLSLDARFAATDGAQNVTLNGTGADLKVAGATLHRFKVEADAQDLYRRPVVNADASIDQARVAGQTVSAATFTAIGTAARSAMTLSARAAGFDLSAAGALVPGAAMRLDLARFAARRGGRAVTLAGPANFILDEDGVAIRHLAVIIAGGRLSADGHAGKTLDLAVEAKAIPLAAADIVMPGLGLGGVLDASAKIGGTAAAPTGPYMIAVKRLTLRQTKRAGAPPIDIAATGKLDGRRASLDATVSAGRAGTLKAAGSLPLDIAGALDLTLKGMLDATAANAALGVSGRTVSGRVLINAKLAGTKAAPDVSGGATMNGGTFRDSLLGVRLDSIDARVTARGDHVSVERLSAATPGGGTLSGSGQIRLDPDAGFPGNVMLRGRQAQLVSSSLMAVTADLALDVSGALARDPRVAGRIDLTHVDVAVPDRLPTTLKPIDGITHVNAPPETQARLALMRERQRAVAGTNGRAAVLDAALDVTIAAPNRIFVRGRGIDAELGGALRVTGTTNAPMPNGAFDLRRGKLTALGKTLTFTKGKLTFTGDLVPELDFAAQIQSGDITAQIAVTGPAAAPVFAFSSTPDLPQDEILSRVLFQKPSGNLSGFQALQLAQAAAQFSSGGDGAFESLRKSLGVDSLDIGADTSGPSVGISRAISDRVSVGVRTGATADQTGLSADIDVTKHIRVQSDVRSNGATSVGVGTEVEY